MLSNSAFSDPLVSVIIPVYNAEKFVYRCYESLSKQTLQNIEFIFIDDGSSDKSFEFIQLIQKSDSRISCHSKVNQGAGIARNFGLEKAKGEYVGFMDIDDDIAPNMFEKLVTTAKLYHADAVSCGHLLIHESGKNEERSDVAEIEIFNNASLIREHQLGLISPNTISKASRVYSCSVWCTLFKKSVIDRHQIKFYSERELVSEDLVFRVEFLNYADFVVLIPDLLYYYSKNEGSLTTTIFLDKFYRMFQLKQRINHLLPDLSGQDRTNKLICDYLRSLLLMSLFVNGNSVTRGYIKEVVHSHEFLGLIKEFPPNKIRRKSKRLFYRLLICREVNLAFLYLYLIKIYKVFKSQKS